MATKRDKDTPGEGHDLNTLDLDSDEPTLLVVDDHAENLEMMVHCLEENGFKALVAGNGALAIERAAYVHPDLILLDVLMPGMDGFETCAQLKSNAETHDIPVIFMTALHDEKHKLKGFSAGGVDYVSKPIQKKEMLARVGAHLEIRRHRKRLEHEIRKRTRDLEKANQSLRRENIERKQAEAAVRKQLKTIESQDRRLKEADRLMRQNRLSAMGEMAAGIAHEINQPLSIINLTADGLAHYLSERQDEKEFQVLMASVKKILIQARRAVAVIDGMHSFLRSNATPSIEVDLKEPLSLAASFFQRTFDKQGILFEMNLADDVPPVAGDDQKISQIAVNLLGNAQRSVLEKAKANGDEGPKKIRLSLAFDPIRKMAVFEVWDNGMGMGKEALDRCVEPFYTTRDEGAGTGLGLFMVQEIAKEFGMEMHVESVEGEGATFRFSTPVLNDGLAEK